MAARGANRHGSAEADGAVKRKPGRPPGTPASAKQKAAAVENRKKAVAARRKQKDVRDALKAKGVAPRWKQLEQGTITVKDLTDDECVRGEVANNDGTWDGRRHQLAPRMIQAMRTEYKRRFRNKFDQMAPLALDAIEDILQDDEARAQQLAAAKMLVEYQIGKPVEVIHVGGETEWDRLQGAGFVILRGEDNVTVERNELHEIVAGEVVDSE